MDRIWPLLLLVPVAPALLLACTSQTCDIPEDAWWEVCTDTGDVDDTGDEGDDTGEDEWDEGVFVVVELLVDGTSVQEAEIGYVSATEDGLRCEAWHTIRDARTTDCAECEHAWTLVIEEGSADGPECDGWPMETGAELTVGWSGTLAYLYEDGAWVPKGDAEQWDDGGMELIFFMD